MTFWTVWILAMLGAFSWDDCHVNGSRDIGGYQVKTFTCGVATPPTRARRR